MRLIKFVAFVFLVFFVSETAFAHQPIVVNSTLIEVTNPEVSKGYYGELSGLPQIYRIQSTVDFDLYLNVLVPKSSNPTGRYSLNLYKVGDVKKFIGKIDVGSTDWKETFEPFGNDTYYQGPEYTDHVSAGTYEVAVHGSSEDVGEYVLAIGKTEQFGPSEIIHTLLVVPQLKRDFFHVPAADFLLSPIGGGCAVLMVMGGFLSGALLRFVLKKTIVKNVVCNLKNIDRQNRLIRLLAGIICLLIGYYYYIPFLFALAGFCFYEAIFSWCGVFALMGKNVVN